MKMGLSKSNPNDIFSHMGICNAFVPSSSSSSSSSVCHTDDLSVIICAQTNTPCQNYAYSSVPLGQDNVNYSDENVRLYHSSENSCSIVKNESDSLESKHVTRRKTRIKWTHDLHNQFLLCVERLGGAEKATPKAIMKMMNTDGLSILHVKSHLQKYRIARHIPESVQGRTIKNSGADSITWFDSEAACRGVQVVEALKQQLDVQRCLSKQLEIHRDLDRRIEEEWKRLRQMMDRNLQRQKDQNT